MKTTKKLLRTCLALLLVVFSLSSGMVVGAAGKVKLTSTTLWLGSKENPIRYQNMSEDEWDEALPVSVTSDNSKVIKVVKNREYPDDIEYGYTLTALKAGTAKITVVYEYKDKEVTLSATYTVKKAPKPFASIEVKGKKMNLKKNPYQTNWKLNADSVSKLKVKVKLNKGWKLKEMYYIDFMGEDWKVKNGGTFKYDGSTALHIVAINGKKEKFEYVVYVYDPEY